MVAKVEGGRSKVEGVPSGIGSRRGTGVRRGRPSTLNPQPSTPRRGSVLLIVLVVVAMLTFATYVFTQSMVVEHRASDAFEHDVRARTCVDSAIELTAAYLGEEREPGDEGFHHRPDLFKGIVVYDPVESATNRTPAGRYSIVAAAPSENGSTPLRFGLVDESAMLNLNQLVGEEVDEDFLTEADANGGFLSLPVAGDIEIIDDIDLELFQRERLMVIPSMTEELADCILDWLDADDEPRRFGAEGPDHYEALGYSPTNGPMESLDELLLVKGVTRAMLYGEDTNRNGLLDPNENDGEASLPVDDADGTLNAGWLSYFTVRARESNWQTDGSERLDLNEPLLTELFDALEPEIGYDAAQFVTAFRVAGPVNQDVNSMNPLGGLATGDEKAVQEFATAVAKAVANGDGAVTRAGLDLRDGGPIRIDSIYQLIDAEVEIEVEGVLTTLVSPWSSNNLDAFLPELMDQLTTVEGEFIDGRINVNQARVETLLTVPGISEEMARLIVESAPSSEQLANAAELMPGRSTTGWLVTSGLVDLETMRLLDPYLTAEGDVHRAQIIGFFDHGGPVARVEVVLDATILPVRVAAVRDLTPLGMGYPRRWLAPSYGSSTTGTTGLVGGSTATGQ